jgi:hypothetical protein
MDYRNGGKNIGRVDYILQYNVTKLLPNFVFTE